MNGREVVLTIRTDPAEVGTIRATIRSPAWTREAWFSTEGVALRQDATPFVPIALLAAMHFRARLVIDGEVSPLLLSNLDRIQTMFCVMRPRWRVVEVTAQAAPVRPPASGTAAFLSMGLDSLALALTRRDDITHLVHLRHFGAESPPLAQRIELAARELAERDGKELILVDSNVRGLFKGVANWTRAHAAGLAASALALSPVAGRVMIASTRWYMETLIYPSNPLLDPLWSSDETTISHEGEALSRTEKAMQVAGDPIAMRYIHPCFVATGEQYNCGRCGKCLRTMAALRVAGVVDAPAFDRPLDLRLLASQPGTAPVLDAKYREQLWGALMFAPDDVELVDALQAAMMPPKSRLERARLKLGRTSAI